jgi:hypothetical protein
MTFEILEGIIKKHNIPKDVRLLSDSGWECCETEMDGVFYNVEENHIIFTQDNYSRSSYKNARGYKDISEEVQDD